MPNAPQPSCPLCASAHVFVEDLLNGAEIIKLWEVGGRKFSLEALQPMDASTPVPLQRCRACGFRFYPAWLAGSGKFYEELMAGGYYVESRPEFDFALRFMRERGLQSVLDVGGGAGGFLDLARAGGARTYGAELNQSAAAEAAKKGHTMCSKLLAEISLEDVGGGVDIVTLHQVVEHVPDPLSFVRDAARLARPGGFVMFAVPNEYRICGLVPYDPANWPPHHVTRWRKRDLRTLAKLAGLEVVREGSDILLGSALESFIPVHNRLAEAIGRPQHVIDAPGARVVSLLYRTLGLKHVFPRLGLSIYLIAQKPAARP